MGILGAGIALVAGAQAGKKLLKKKGSKVKAQTEALPTIQRNVAADRAALSDVLARRTGQRGTRRVSQAAGESTQGKTSLLGR